MKEDKQHLCTGLTWIQLALAVASIIAFILIGMMYIIRAETTPIKIDMEHMKEDIREIKEACKPIKNEDELCYFIDGRIEHFHKDDD